MDTKHETLFNRAIEAGIVAGEAATPTPMRIKGYAPIMDGVCGFASVNIAGNTSFGRWIKKTGRGHKAYYGGLDISIRHFDQSYTRKLAMAEAMAIELRRDDVDAYASGRLD